MSATALLVVTVALQWLALVLLTLAVRAINRALNELLDVLIADIRAATELVERHP